MIAFEYKKKIFELIEKIEASQKEKMLAASEIVSQTIRNDGIIYVFGCGHSHLVGLDSFYRAGGLANVSAMLDTDLMLHNGAAKSSHMEKMEGLASEVFRRYTPNKNDCIFIISSSGINGVPIDMALSAKNAGVRSVAITSTNYAEEKSRHSSGKKLYEVADMYIDNCVPHGDAVIDIGGKMMGSISTIAGTFILQSVLMEAAEKCISDGVEIPVYMSGNVENGGQYNKALIDKYLSRIKHL